MTEARQFRRRLAAGAGMVLAIALLLGLVQPASALSPVGALINNSCTLTQSSSAVFVMAHADTLVVDNWIAMDSNVLATVVAGETVWLPFTVTNEAGVADTVTLDTTSLLGWRVTLWDSRSAALRQPLATVQPLAALQKLQFYMAACTTAGAGTATDTVRVRAISAATATAHDSAYATISLGSQLHHFAVDAPDTVYVGMAFGISVVACYDAAGNVMANYNKVVTVTVDTGTRAPGVLVLANGLCSGVLTISDCVDTFVRLGISEGGISETVTIWVFKPRIAFNKLVYQGLTERMLITVWDAGQDTPPGVINNVLVRVVSDADATGITVTLTETGLATGIFTGEVRFTQGASQENAIKLNSNGNIIVTYDPDGVGGVAAVSAQANWIALVVSDLEHVRSWPNPYRPDRDGMLVIHQLPSDPGMTIEIYNTAAQRLRTLRVGAEITVTPQENVARWNGCSESGGTLASGTYVYVVKSAAGMVVRKLTVVR